MKRLALGTLGTLCAVAAGVFLPLGSIDSAARTASANVSQLLASRSPGERPSGALLQTKPGYAVGINEYPGKPLLTDFWAQEPGLMPPLEFALPDAAIPISLPDLSAPSIAAVDQPWFDVPGFALDLRPPSYAGGVGVPVSPVPEPGAWVLMVVGVGIAGVVMRRERHRVLFTSFGEQK